MKQKKPNARTAKRAASKPAVKAKAGATNGSSRAGKALKETNGKAAAQRISVKPQKSNGAAAHHANGSNGKATGKSAKAQNGRHANGNGSAASPSVSKLIKVKNTKRAIKLPANYQPNDAEPFMGARQQLYFRMRLENWKDEIVRQAKQTLQSLTEESAQHADLADRATSESDKALELRARDRQRKLIAKIDSALRRIEEGEYGYCEVTGEPIGIGRLIARPIATMTVEAQEAHERREKISRED